jgi:FeS assembly SUF system regulator
MLRLTKLSDYAIVVMTHLAADPDRARANAKDVAAEAHLPAPMVSKVLKALARRGLLVSQRGSAGGYVLARPAAEISVADIIEALDGPLALAQCCEVQPESCDHQPVCPVTGHWHRINTAIWGALKGIRLAEMASPLPAERAPVLRFHTGRSLHIVGKD